MPHALLILWLVVLLAPVSVWAGSCEKCVKGPYFRFSGLAFENQDSDIRYQPDPAIASSLLNGRSLEFDTGFGFSAAYGFRSAEFLNTELEFSARWTGLDTLNTASGSAPAGGDLNAYSFMLNAPWQFRNRTPFTPYLGGGLGISWNRADFDPLPDGSTVAASGDEVNLTYQILAGIAYAIDPRWEVVLGYRFYGSTNPQYGTVTLDNRSHNLELGLRYYLPEKKPVRKKRRAGMKPRSRRGPARRR